MQRTTTIYIVLSLALASVTNAGSTPLVRTYQGDSFFDRWDYWGNYDNTTEGDVTYAANLSSASSLTYVTSSSTAIIKVDNTSTVAYNDKRESVKILSQDTYSVGSVWVLDAVHLPYGCSVWPSFWSYDKSGTWPDGGEIDVFEGVNNQPNDQMALHTTDGCNITTSSLSSFSGTVNDTSCYYEDNDNSGCGITVNTSLSYGSAFASAGGGVYVTEFASTGISIWFYSRADIPAAVSNASDSIDTSTLGTPSGWWGGSGCDIDTFFGDQTLIFDITLCGNWAGQSSILETTGCAALATGQTCYTTYVLDSSNYDNAYFEINSLKVYSNSSSSSDSTSSSTSDSGPRMTSPGGLGLMWATSLGVACALAAFLS
ncbi:concanavalin A-like lectin/glucanase domain-containing protein [Naematelia encephala]|uniref:Concanavalin A-like lectin/glucanase domain-containing protein n=1 Tax=Naematelia encephala TaxID=71784 RepID=A0A1Y2AYJ2_9TREE|nr:concanavalin A-like lectin/glucanase domain-containing protein [Naematelia encephala]